MTMSVRVCERYVYVEPENKFYFILLKIGLFKKLWLVCAV